jgi:hypothetical protein
MNISFEAQLLILGAAIGLFSALIALAILFLLNSWLEKKKHELYRDDALWLDGKKKEIEWREILDELRETPSDFRQRDQKRKKYDFWRFAPKLILSTLLVGAVLFSLWFNIMQMVQGYAPILPAASITPTPVAASQNLEPISVEKPADISAPTATPTTFATIEEDTQPTASPTPIPTLSPTPDPSPTPTSTPLGGGTGQIAFASDRSGISQIWLMNSDGTNPVQITDTKRGACQPDWSPDGTRLVYISPCESKKQEIYRGASLFVINLESSEMTPLPTLGGGDYDPDWSPDGKKIAFTSVRNGNRPQIFVLDLETYEVVGLSDKFGRDFQPDWSSDGSQILFISNRRGPYHIWTMNADGTNQKRFTTNGSLKNTFPVWSPDNESIVFSQSEEGSLPGLFVAAYPDGAAEAYHLNPFPYLAPMQEANFSLDGLWLVFETWPKGFNHEIFIMKSDGTELTQLTTETSWDFDPAWRPSIP